MTFGTDALSEIIGVDSFRHEFTILCSAEYSRSDSRTIGISSQTRRFGIPNSYANHNDPVSGARFIRFTTCSTASTNRKATSPPPVAR
jgi:hypothetical protein